MKTELASKEKFGGGTAPTVAIEAPFWGVNDQRLEAGEERELEDAPAGPTKLSRKIIKTGQTKGTRSGNQVQQRTRKHRHLQRTGDQNRWYRRPDAQQTAHHGRTKTGIAHRRHQEERGGGSKDPPPSALRSGPEPD
jgi:hypothetical protein